MDELKPCPFCGEVHEVSITTDMHWGRNWSISCRGKTVMQVWTERDIPGMVDRWNHRPIEDMLQAQVDKLKWANQTQHQLIIQMGDVAKAVSNSMKKKRG